MSKSSPANTGGKTSTAPLGSFYASLIVVVAIAVCSITLSGSPSAAMPLLPAAGCLIGSVLAVGGVALEPPPSLHSPIQSRYTGRWSYLTFQTNVISALYFAMCMFTHLVPGTVLDEYVVPCFPLAFALDLLLTPLYYALDHFNAERLQKVQHWSKRGFPYVNVASHLCHAPGAVIAFVAAFSIREVPSAHATTTGVCTYLIIYLSETVLNRWATGVWIYPVLEDVQKAAKLPGVAAFILAVCAVGASLAHLGKAIVELRLA